VLVTGFDIIFFWVARMIMMSLYFTKQIPFKDVYIHALVRDEKGQKMSKSKGNVLDPMELVDEYGADALRFTLAFYSVPGRDIKIGREHVKISRNFMTKIWNAARFLQNKGISFDKKISKTSIKDRINQWLLVKLHKFRKEIDINVNEYRFDYMAKNTQVFLREIFCDFYIEAIKTKEDEETLSVVSFVFGEFLKITHPIIPFITDHLANILGVTDSLIKASVSTIDEVPLYSDSEKEIDKIIEQIHLDRANNKKVEIKNYL
jgi:valyl-tRNA synthetase